MHQEALARKAAKAQANAAKAKVAPAMPKAEPVVKAEPVAKAESVVKAEPAVKSEAVAEPALQPEQPKRKRQRIRISHVKKEKVDF